VGAVAYFQGKVGNFKFFLALQEQRKPLQIFAKFYLLMIVFGFCLLSGTQQSGNNFKIASKKN
jgi:hypothetical protein